jgi:hypothetical protein
MSLPVRFACLFFDRLGTPPKPPPRLLEPRDAFAGNVGAVTHFCQKPSMATLSFRFRPE